MSPEHEFVLKLFFVGGILLFFAFVWFALTEDGTVSQADEIDLAFAHIKQAGGQNPGVTYLEGGPLVWWTDGKTHKQLTLPLSKIHSVFDISDHMRQSREKFECAGK